MAIYFWNYLITNKNYYQLRDSKEITKVNNIGENLEILFSNIDNFVRNKLNERYNNKDIFFNDEEYNELYEKLKKIYISSIIIYIIKLLINKYQYHIIIYL